MHSEHHNSLSNARGAQARVASMYFYGYWFSRYGV